MSIKRPPGWLDEGQIMGLICDEVDAKLAADPAAKYEHLKEIGTVRRSRDDGCTVREFEVAYGVTVPAEDHWDRTASLAAE